LSQEKEDRAHPILIDGAVVEQVESFKFLGVHITNKLTCSKHTKTAMKRARQHLVRRKDLVWVLRSSKGSTAVPFESITAWYGNCLASNRKALQRVEHTAQYITGAKHPATPNL
jgi:hypothetical protein